MLTRPDAGHAPRCPRPQRPLEPPSPVRVPVSRWRTARGAAPGGLSVWRPEASTGGPRAETACPSLCGITVAFGRAMAGLPLSLSPAQTWVTPHVPRRRPPNWGASPRPGPRARLCRCSRDAGPGASRPHPAAGLQVPQWSLRWPPGRATTEQGPPQAPPFAERLCLARLGTCTTNRLRELPGDLTRRPWAANSVFWSHPPTRLP